MENVFRGVVIELNADMSEEEIDRILRNALSDPMKLQLMAIEALRRARYYFNCKNKVDKLLEAVARFQDGDVGYWFPYGFSATCRSYANDKHFKPENYPPWCVVDGRYEGHVPKGKDGFPYLEYPNKNQKL